MCGLSGADEDESDGTWCVAGCNGDTPVGNDQGDGQLESIQTKLTSGEVFSALSKLSKQGKLAGYEYESGSDEATVDAHGTPFDSDLYIRFNDGELCFRMVMRRKLPVIFALILVATVWPGLPLTDSFLFGYQWYERLMGDSIKTWMWYLPLTVLPIPFVWRSSMMKSRSSAREHAQETIEKLRNVFSLVQSD